MGQNGHDVAVVSGASSGFGTRTAELLAVRGFTVVALARRANRLEELARRCPGIVPLIADVRDAKGLREAFTQLPDEFQDVSVIVNNAGLSKGFRTIQDGSPSDWQEMVDTNVTGLLNLTDLLLPGLVARRSGHVVNIGSIAARYPYMGGNVYAATKAFVHQLSLNMRVDLQGTGVQVSCIAPGMAKTEFAEVRFNGDVERADALYEGVVPLSADDVAECVVWCLSRPPHVNVNMIEIMPADQPFGLGFAQTGRGQAAPAGESAVGGVDAG
ncbi:SDR family NAD(P)-dependent oxidoreductase [Streptomyces sp. NPDC056921]|uniref:SDR family NAD(P)-dependent oxidoreductase n=1 Tax=Streptomyces sp. NPDC056921 TaxID=3345966 RepID=UPI00363A3BAD